MRIKKPGREATGLAALVVAGGIVPMDKAPNPDLIA